MSASDPAWATVAELSALLRAKKVSSVELTRDCLKRAAALDPGLHAWVTMMGESALEEARQAEKEIGAGRIRGPLHGVPYGAKDLLSTRGVRTTWGARPYEAQVFDRDAAVVRRLREAGAILIGKLAMIELAGGLGYTRGDASLTGAARNPWDTARWTCGSSSGAGAAVGSGTIPFAIGSETWGSILCPSSFCGISGLRPTFGRVSRDGAMALSWTLDKLGPMARTAGDCETVLRAIAGHDPDDPYSADEPQGPVSDIEAARRYTVGYLALDFTKMGNRSVQLAFHRALVDLSRAGVVAEEVKLPDLPFEAVTGVILGSEVSTAFEELERDGRVRQLATPTARLSFVSSRAVRGADLVKAERIRTLCQRAMADLFERYDVILYPSEMHTAFGAEEDFSQIAWADPGGAAGNLCGLPALSVPCGFGDDGLPAGLAILASAFDEAKAVAVGRLYQFITDWHERRPPLPRAS
jgi:aspartyl-tRNA(Asn)/glutamyl-tRNA(Gln) amidotransferase subunit A